MELIGSNHKKTLLVGATTNPDRYAFFAAQLFDKKGVDFIPIGVKKGEVFGKEILELQTTPKLEAIDTITLYLRPSNQTQWIDYFLSLKPKRIIFNPGTENPDFFKRAQDAGIEVLSACTLVMLQTNQYL
jgi:uncharacterized protein